MSIKLNNFTEKYKRKPRVLHIGNIANNAYNNAKLLNELGFDCDVLCANYYHIMGCPEWEDALIEGDIENHFSPDWTSVNLNGFKRPRWFVQGPLGLSIKYLLAKRTRNKTDANKYWRILGCINHTSCPGTRERIWAFVWEYNGMWERILRHISNPEFLIMAIYKRFLQLVALPAHLLWKVNEKILSSRWFQYVNSVTPQKIKRLVNISLSKCTSFFRYIGRAVLSVAAYIINSIVYIINKFPAIKEDEEIYNYLIEKIQKEHTQLFGKTNPEINLVAVMAMSRELARWKRLFDQYDIIQAYATDPVYPYLAETEYFTFEHGTLREIPFDGTVIGSLTALAYTHAEHVFVTNTDCVENAKRLAGDRVTVIPHPFDERRMDSVKDWESLREQLKLKLGVDYLIFFPTRHDWIENHGFADKANDRLLKAFARLRRAGVNVGLICCRWGHNFKESEKLIKNYGCHKQVAWYEPMCVVRFEQMIKACDVVADQFLLGAFGGVTFRGLAAGRPVCTYLKDEEVAASYGEVPPVVNCQTEDEIFAVLSELFDQPGRIAEIGHASAEWIHNYHSGMTTARTQAQQYMKLLESRYEVSQLTNELAVS